MKLCQIACLPTSKLFYIRSSDFGTFVDPRNSSFPSKKLGKCQKRKTKNTLWKLYQQMEKSLNMSIYTVFQSINTEEKIKRNPVALDILPVEGPKLLSKPYTTDVIGVTFSAGQ